MAMLFLVLVCLVGVFAALVFVSSWAWVGLAVAAASAVAIGAWHLAPRRWRAPHEGPDPGKGYESGVEERKSGTFS